MTEEGTLGIVAFAAGLVTFAVAALALVAGVADDVVLAVLRWGGPTLWASLLVPAVIASVFAVAAFSGDDRHCDGHVVRRGRDVEVHTAPNQERTVTRRRKVAAEHEAGHMAAGRARGWTVRGAEVFDDGSGVTRLRLGWLCRYDPRDDIAVSLAGGKAARTWLGCGSDLAYAQAARDSLPEAERAAAWREGNQRADSALFWRSGQRARDSRVLQREGVA